MSDFMAHDGSQLGLGVEMGEDAAGHVDEAAWNGKSVDRFVIDDLELPGEFRSLGHGRHSVADILDVLLECLIGVEAELGGDAFVVLHAHSNFLLLADKRKLPSPGRRVECARRGDDQRADGEGCFSRRHQGF